MSAIALIALIKADLELLYIARGDHVVLKDNFDLSVMCRPFGRINLQNVSEAIVSS